MEELEAHPSIYEIYLDLLCQYQPIQVSSYLKNHEGYHLESILEVNFASILFVLSALLSV